MKTCPICSATCFDDMEVCYGCLHRFKKDEKKVQKQDRKCECAGASSHLDSAPSVGSLDSPLDEDERVCAGARTITVPAIAVAKPSDVVSDNLATREVPLEQSSPQVLFDSLFEERLADEMGEDYLDESFYPDDVFELFDEKEERPQPSMQIITPDGWSVFVEVPDFTRGMTIRCERSLALRP